MGFFIIARMGQDFPDVVVGVGYFVFIIEFPGMIQRLIEIFQGFGILLQLEIDQEDVVE